MYFKSSLIVMCSTSSRLMCLFDGRQWSRGVKPLDGSFGSGDSDAALAGMESSSSGVASSPMNATGKEFDSSNLDSPGGNQAGLDGSGASSAGSTTSGGGGRWIHVPA